MVDGAARINTSFAIDFIIIYVLYTIILTFLVCPIEWNEWTLHSILTSNRCLRKRLKGYMCVDLFGEFLCREIQHK